MLEKRIFWGCTFSSHFLRSSVVGRRVQQLVGWVFRVSEKIKKSKKRQKKFAPLAFFDVFLIFWFFPQGVYNSPYQSFLPNVDFSFVFKRFCNALAENVINFPTQKSIFDCFCNVFWTPRNSQDNQPDQPETGSAPPEQALGSPRRGPGWRELQQTPSNHIPIRSA